MSAPPLDTLIHYIIQPTPATAWHLACTGEQWSGDGTANVGDVTCFACRRTPEFRAAQLGVGGSTPLPQRQTPRLLRDIIAESAELRDIIKAGLNAGTNDAEHEALTELADHFGLSYNEDTDTYS